jgi:hypothetical protein
MYLAMDRRARQASAETRQNRSTVRIELSYNPASCKLRRHRLAETGYHAREENRVLWVSCLACAEAQHPDFAWELAATPPAPAYALRRREGGPDRI